MSRVRYPQCAGCGIPWDDSQYCPACQEDSDELRAWLAACPGCGGTSPDPGDLCPACAESVAEHRLEDDDPCPPYFVVRGKRV